MTTPALPGDPLVTDGGSGASTLAGPPPMPSIAASALLESRLLADRTRRTVAAWLGRG